MMASTRNRSPADNRFQAQQAEDSLAKNGRTFHWARRFLGPHHGPDAARLYAFCRLLDDLADGDLPDGKRRLLQIHRDLITLSSHTVNSSKANTATLPYLQDKDMAAFASFMIAKNLPAKAFEHLIDGLLFDQGTVALDDESALILYGYQVAGTVGLMMCPVLSCFDKQASNFAIDLGIAMQFTNIARDVLEDAQMGRRYLPADWVDGLTAAEIAQGAAASDEAVLTIIRRAIQKLLLLADTYYQSGFSGLAYLPKRARIAIAIAGYSYREIGTQLQANGLNWHKGRTVTSTLTKARVSLGAIRYLAPQHPPARHQSDLHKALSGYLT
ncbi:MAG: phytoene/squalene synthase family protein [Candidatus Puniceispirillaceae bacterium]